MQIQDFSMKEPVTTADRLDMGSAACTDFFTEDDTHKCVNVLMTAVNWENGCVQCRRR